MLLNPEWKKVAVDLAYQAGELMRESLNENVRQEIKSDLSAVTKVDLAISDLVQKTIKQHFPDHGLVEEESGVYQEDQEYKWVCDPLDGTLAFANGIPTSCFSIALTQNGESILGVVYDPYLDRLFYGAKGEGATLNGEKIHVSEKNDWQESQFGMCPGGIIEEYNLLNIVKVLNKRKIDRVFVHSSIYVAMLVATGKIPSAVYSSIKPWDSASVKIIVEEAGGKVTDLFGNDQRYDGKTNGVVVSNGKVHEQALKIIGECLRENNS